MAMKWCNRMQMPADGAVISTWIVTPFAMHEWPNQIAKKPDRNFLLSAIADNFVFGFAEIQMRYNKANAVSLLANWHNYYKSYLVQEISPYTPYTHNSVNTTLLLEIPLRVNIALHNKEQHTHTHTRSTRNNISTSTKNSRRIYRWWEWKNET